MSKFQIIVLGAFVIFIIAGVAFFATYEGDSSSTNDLQAITIWGTFPQETFDRYVSSINQGSSMNLKVNYIEKNKNTFSQEFISALARGQGPDGILVPADSLFPHLDKITLIPYEVFPQRSFMDTYIQEGEIYLSQGGLRALPFVVDPMVMYWNRDTFAGAGLATYPKTWDEFGALNKKMTVIDQNGNIRKTAVAMGDFTNVLNARELLASLMMQFGNPITQISGNFVENTFEKEPSIVPIVEFFVKFANPNDKDYSWNRGMPDSKTAFLSGVLATYFGFASELADIRNKNRNLNFDVAALPQFVSGTKAVYGKMYGFSILSASPRQNDAYKIFSILTNPNYLSDLSNTMYLPSVRRDLIAQGSKDAYISIFNTQALIAKTWLDADPVKSYNLFGNMVNSVTSGAKTARSAVADAGDQYDVILHQALQ